MRKINIIAEKEAFIKLGSNEEFCRGRVLKHILQNRAEVILIMEENQFDAEWNDSESRIRSFVDAYDLPKPQAFSSLQKIYTNPALCCEVDPFAIWLFDKKQEDIEKFREYLGVWAINVSELNDDYFFYIDHSTGPLDENDRIKGTRGNGWGNFLKQIPKPLPPLNSIVLNDRYLVDNINKCNGVAIGLFGLINLITLLDELLPHNLKIPFHLFIYCRHPNLDIITTDTLFSEFVTKVKELRSYTICVELVYAFARHKRGLYTNYFYLDADSGFNAFKIQKGKASNVLRGQNKLKAISYMSDPLASGATHYENTCDTIKKIFIACKEVVLKPNEVADDNKDIERVQTESDDFFLNRLFKPVQLN